MKWLMPLLAVLLSFSVIFSQEPLLREEQEFLFADQLEKRGMHDLAAVQFHSFAKTFPTSSRTPDALLRSGDNYALVDSLAKASQAYMTVVLRYSQSPVAGKAAFQNAKLLENNKEFLEAAVAYERVKMLAPDHELIPDAQIQAAHCYFAVEHYQNSMDAAFYILENHRLHPLRLKARYYIAQSKQQLGEFQEALNDLAKIKGERVADDFSVQVALLTADILREMGRFNRADSVLIAMLDKAASAPHVKAAAVELGQSLHDRGEYEQSNEIINSVLSKVQTEQRAPLYRILGDNAFAQKEYSRALNNYELVQLKFLASTELPAMYFRLAKAQMQTGAYADALDNFNNVIADSLAQPVYQHKAALEAGTLLTTLNQALAAIQLLQNRIELAAQSQFRSEILLQMADIQLRALHDNVAAKSSYQAVLATAPKSSFVDDARYGLAQVFEHEKKYDAALEEYERYVNYYPGGNFYTQAVEKIKMLTFFAPPNSKDAAGALNSILMQNLNGAPQAELLYYSAVQQADVFHDYEQALVLLARAQQADVNERLDKNNIIENKAECYYRLYQKANQDKNILHKHAWQDSLASIAVAAKSLAAVDHDKIQYYFIQTRLDDFATPQERVVFLNENIDSVASDSLVLELKYLTALSMAVQKDDSLSQQAAQLLQSVIQATPNPSLKMNALYHQALLLQKQGLLDSAKTVLIDLATLPGPTKKAQAAFLVAQLEEQKGNFASAVILYDKVVQDYFYTDFAVWARLKAIELLLEIGKTQSAIERISTIKPVAIPSDLKLFYNELSDKESAWIWANISAHTQSPLFAIREFQNYLNYGENIPHRAQALFKIAQLADQADKMDMALGHYKECAESFPQDSLGLKALSRTADIYFDRSMYSEAREAYKAIQPKLDGDLHRNAVLFEIICTYRLGELAEAQAAFKNYKKEFDDRNGQARLLYEEGSLQIGRKNFNTAEKLLKQVADRYDDVPAGARGELGLARLYVVTNKVEEALKRLTHIPENYTDPEIVGTAYLNLADFYYENRQLENCRLAALQVLERFPKGDTRAQAMNLLIHAYDDFQIKDKALFYTRQYVHEFPMRTDAMNHRIRIGTLLNDIKEYDRAIAYLTELKPQVSEQDEIEVQYLIAKSYDDAGLTERSIIEYLKVKMVCKQNTKLPWGATALYKAGLAYRKLGKYDKAIEMLQLVIKEKGIADPFGREANSKIQDIKVEMNRENS